MSRESSEAPFGPVILLAAATLLQIAMSSIQQGVPVLAVFFRQEMHLTLAQMGAIGSSLYFGRIVGNMTAGPLVDRFGPRSLQGWGTGCVVVLTLTMLLLTSYGALLIGLFFLGTTLATGPSSGSRSVFHVFRGERRGLAMGIRQSGVPFGGAVAAAVIPSVLAGSGVSEVWVGMATVTGLTGLAFTLVAPSWRSGEGSKRLFAPISELRGIWTPWLVGFLMAAGQSSTLSFVIVDLHGRHGWPIALAGAGLALALVGGGIGRMGSGWLSDRFGGRRATVLGGIACVGAAAALLMGWLPARTPMLLIAPVLFALGVGTMGWNALAMTWAGERLPEAHAGQAMGWTASFVGMGMVIDPPLFGHFVDVTHQYGPAWTAVGVMVAGAAAVAFWSGRLSPGRRPAGTAS